jgi:phenol hydroxylase P1 protein
MSLDIKTVGSEPKRHTFAHVARRLGGDRPATRYQEATYDWQAVANFHYRPSWDATYELHDTKRTQIVMHDWYAFLDPRQFYYGTYTQARAKLGDQFEKALGFVEKVNALSALPPQWLATVGFYLLPLRHYEWGANMNNCAITAYGYGTALTQASMFETTDRLGLAQMLSRIGLAIDGHSGSSLDEAKTRWMDDARWQPLRRLVEDTLVVEDWFELLVAQDLALDGIVHPLFFGEFDAEGRKHDATAITLLGEAFVDWYADTTRWVDSVIKIAAKESDANAGALSGWYEKWVARAVEAVEPIANEVLGASAGASLVTVRANLDRRASAAGLTI